jgi:lipoate-protein ligase A
LTTAETAAETGNPHEFLWFWESKIPFLVLGYGQKTEIECNVNVCDTEKIPILRRCSGGGAVLQGPGSWNYGLVLSVSDHGPLTSITGANTWVMERNRRILETLLGQPVSIRGHTDLAVSRCGRELKISGNAQRRKRRTLLFHGTILRALDLSAISRFLRPPSVAPEYRAEREHQDFVTNTGLPREALEHAFITGWHAASSGAPAVRDRSEIEPWLSNRYGRTEWHRRI